MPRIDQAMSQPLLVAGCEPIPFASCVMGFLGITAIFSFSPNVTIPLLPLFIGAIICLRKIAEFDPKFFRVAWTNTMPGIRSSIRGTLGVGQSLWDMPTAKRSIPMIKDKSGRRGL